MKLFKWGYGALSIAATICLIASLFLPDVQPITQITFVIQSVGFGWLCGLAIGADM